MDNLTKDQRGFISALNMAGIAHKCGIQPEGKIKTTVGTVTAAALEGLRDSGLTKETRGDPGGPGSALIDYSDFQSWTLTDKGAAAAAVIAAEDHK